MISFVLAMCNFPQEQKKAQAEIDRVIGHDRMPDFDDEASLPLVMSLVKETLRWRPVAGL